MKDTEEIDFPALGVKVWNYSKKADTYITNSDLRTTLDSLMAMNVTHKATVTDMGIITIGEFDCREYSDEEKAICREVQKLLFIGAISYSSVLDRGANTGHYMFTSDNFNLLQQSFELNGERNGIQTGSIVAMSAMGYKINELKFRRPDYVPTPMQFRGNSKVVADLLKMRKYQKRIYNRLMRSIDLLMQAYFNDTNHSMHSRILLLSSAYETLFNLPEGRSQRRVLKERFEEYFVLPNDVKRRYTSRRPGTPSYVWETNSIKVMWADKFYTLRNDIIHGSPLKVTDFDFRDKQRHLDIAVLFFVLGLKKIMGNTPQVKQTVDEIVWRSHDDMDGEDEEYQYEGFCYEELDSWNVIIRSMMSGG